MPRKNEPQEFTVQGSGIFPFDMLRYDRCFPKTQTDTSEIEETTRRSIEIRRVTLVTVSEARPPTGAGSPSGGRCPDDNRRSPDDHPRHVRRGRHHRRLRGRLRPGSLAVLDGGEAAAMHRRGTGHRVIVDHFSTFPAKGMICDFCSSPNVSCAFPARNVPSTPRRRPRPRPG
jgi:hypothetical protein